MHTRQQASYEARIERALTVLESDARAGQFPDAARLADAAAFSPFHFHRVYRLMTGETVSETIARVRLGGSLPELSTRTGIAAATERSGYATTQGYARALKHAAGVTPSQLRADPERRDRIAEAMRRPAAAAAQAAPLAIEIVSFAPVRLLAVRKLGDYRTLNLGYRNLMEQMLQQIAPENITGLWGIPHDDPRHTSPAECRFDCAISTDGAGGPHGNVFAVDLPASRCLKMRFMGDYDNVHEALDRLYEFAIRQDLPLAEVCPVNHYHSDPDARPVEELATDIHLLLAE